MKFKGLLFDLDGTIVDSIEDLADSMNCILADSGYPTHNVNQYKLFVGSGIRNLVRLALPDIERQEQIIDTCYHLMVEHYNQNCLNKTKPYDGVKDLLDELKTCGLKMSVLSNKADEETNKIIHALLPNYFDIVIGLRSEELKKPNPAIALQIAAEMDFYPEEIVYVGDSDIDMRTAYNAGMYPLGVLWGFRSREQLLESGASRIVSHPREILSFLEQS